MESHDVTTPRQREEFLSKSCFSPEDLVFVGVPVYIGRVPNLIKPFFEKIEGSGAVGIPIVVYGNRNFDDALKELRDILEADGFICPAAAAFIGEHSFSRTLAAGRPDEKDMMLASEFGGKVAGLLAEGKLSGRPELPGNEAPYRFYKAVDDDGHPFDIRKVKPQTDLSKCSGCGICAEICPMGSIDVSDFSNVSGICIKCGACIKRCPAGAKYISDEEYLKHLSILERNFTRERRSPEFFFS